MAYIYDLTDTWNAGGTTFYGIKMNVTNSASASGSKLLSLQVSGSELFGVDKDGNVGIGTTAPNVKLRVDYSNTSFAGGLLVANTANSGNAWGRIDVANTNTGGSLVLAQELSGQVNIINTTNMPMAFGTNNTTRMTIGNTGNVGVGTVTPSRLLEVYATGGAIPFRVGNNLGNLDVGGSDGAVVNIDGRSWALGFQTGGLERGRFDTSGNFGIGTSSPSCLLDVNSDKVRVRTAKTPSSASDTGSAGEICWDASYVYVCTATNTWKRTAISTW